MNFGLEIRPVLYRYTGFYLANPLLLLNQRGFICFIAFTAYFVCNILQHSFSPSSSIALFLSRQPLRKQEI
jgi:hypothetical protein